MSRIRSGAAEWIADAIRGDQDAREAVAFHVGVLVTPILLIAICACF